MRLFKRHHHFVLIILGASVKCVRACSPPLIARLPLASPRSIHRIVAKFHFRDLSLTADFHFLLRHNERFVSWFKKAAIILLPKTFWRSPGPSATGVDKALRVCCFATLYEQESCLEPKSFRALSYHLYVVSRLQVSVLIA